MRDEMQRQKKHDKIKWVLTGIAFFLIAAIVTALCLEIFGKGKVKPSEWFGGDEQERETVIDGGMVIAEPTEESGSSAPIRITTFAIAEEDYAEYGISPQAESAMTVTATVEPDNDATNAQVVWSIGWEGGRWLTNNGSHEEKLSDYVTIGDPYSKTVTLTCLQSFGQPIILTAKCKYDPQISASIQIDYAPKVTSIYRDYYGLLSGLMPNQKKTVNISKFNINSGTSGIPSLSGNYAFLISKYYTLEDSFNVTLDVRNGKKLNTVSSVNYLICGDCRIGSDIVEVTKSDMDTGYAYGKSVSLSFSFYNGWGDSHARYVSFNQGIFNLLNFGYCTPTYNKITSSTSLENRQKYFSKNFDTSQGLLSDVDLCDLKFTFEGTYSTAEFWVTLHINQFVNEAA